jgi:hypothetical protein
MEALLALLQSSSPVPAAAWIGALAAFQAAHEGETMHLVLKTIHRGCGRTFESLYAPILSRGLAHRGASRTEGQSCPGVRPVLTTESSEGWGGYDRVLDARGWVGVVIRTPCRLKLVVGGLCVVADCWVRYVCVCVVVTVVSAALLALRTLMRERVAVDELYTPEVGALDGGGRAVCMQV